jgi:TonB family protein
MKPMLPALRRAATVAALAGFLAPVSGGRAQASEAPQPSASAAPDQPLVAGSDGVPVPKRTKTVQPEYPKEAILQGIRGIVILEVVIDTEGKVASVDVVRSVPPLDEAAIAAVRQWEYTVTKVKGKPVPVRFTVPITFAMKLPELARQEGIPELRQGTIPPYPVEGQAASVTVKVTLDPEGRVNEIMVLEGARPWTDALLQALRTWRFASEDPNVVLSFRVEAGFVPAAKGSPAHVDLRASGPQRSESLASGPEHGKEPSPAQSSPAPGVSSPAAPPAAASPVSAAAPSSSPAVPESSAPPAPPSPVPSPSTPGEKPAPSAPAAPAQVAPSPVPPPSAQATAAPGSSVPPPVSGQAAATPPPVEVINVPPRAAAPASPPESGTSAIRDVALSPGVPDLVRGRRPVAPPLARIAGASGVVDVRFAVDAAGVTSVQAVEGPDLLKPAAQQVVTSWVFRRLSAQRLYLIAAFTYAGDTASAAIRPQDAPDPGPKPEPKPQ